MSNDVKPYPNGLFLSLSFVLIVGGITAAIIYPRVGLDPFDYRGARAKAIYWVGMCIIGIIFYCLSLFLRKTSKSGPSKARVIVGGIVALLGLAFSIFSTPVIIKSMQE